MTLPIWPSRARTAFDLANTRRRIDGAPGWRHTAHRPGGVPSIEFEHRWLIMAAQRSSPASPAWSVRIWPTICWRPPIGRWSACAVGTVRWTYRPFDARANRGDRLELVYGDLRDELSLRHAVEQAARLSFTSPRKAIRKPVSLPPGHVRHQYQRHSSQLEACRSSARRHADPCLRLLRSVCRCPKISCRLTRVRRCPASPYAISSWHRSCRPLLRRGLWLERANHCMFTHWPRRVMSSRNRPSPNKSPRSRLTWCRRWSRPAI